MARDCSPIPRQRAAESEAEDGLRTRYSTRWVIGQTDEGWQAVRRDPRPALQGLSATTARALAADLAHVEEAAR